MNRLALILLTASSCCLQAAEPGEEPTIRTNVPRTGVTFSCNDVELKKLFDAAEKTCCRNRRTYGSMKILVEGGPYNGMWLETQPMGGYMWGKRDLQVAANNFLKFIEFQPKSGHWAGKLPYRVINKVPRDHDKLQGYCWPQPAWELYHALGRDKVFLRAVYDAMVGHDAWLWKNRDADGNGCLENRGHDTGEDGTTRFRYGTPYESMDVMSFSYDGRNIMSLMAAELGDDKAAREWAAGAKTVRDKVKSYLWREELHACYDRDKNNKFTPTLIHNNLRAMYHGVFDQQMADDFVRYHLMNPEEFWTEFPLTSIARNDPLYKGKGGNCGGGEPQLLTYQRTIRALENYGHYANVTMVGRKLLDLIEESLKFTQQIHPKTGVQTGGGGYGPCALSVLEYISRMHGIHVVIDRVLFSGLPRGNSTMEYVQNWGDVSYTVKIADGSFEGLVNGRVVFRATPGVRVVTSLDGTPRQVVGIDTVSRTVKIQWLDKTQVIKVAPNQVYTIDKSGRFRPSPSSPFYQP